MEQPQCLVCARPAEIHETVVEAGSAVTRHYCKIHGQGVMPKLALAADAAARARFLKEAEHYYQGLPENEKEHLQLFHRATHRRR